MKMDDFLNIMRELGAPQDFALPPAARTAAGGWPLANSHIHLPPNFSAFLSVEQAVELAAAQRIDVLGATNYYDFTAYERFTRRARERNVFPLCGLEVLAAMSEEAAAGVKINDPNNPGRMYICGKGIVGWQTPSDRAAALLRKIRLGDSRRMAQMISLVGEHFAACGVDTGLDEQKIIAQLAAKYRCPAESVVLQERHVAQAFQEAFFAKIQVAERLTRLERIFSEASSAGPADGAGVQAEIRSRLMKAGKSCFVEEEFVSFDEAAELIGELKAILCYPVLADGAKPMCAWEEPVEKLIESLQRLHIPMAEFIPLRNEPALLERYVRTIRKAGIAVVAGTEHNTQVLSPMRPTCRGGAPIPAPIAEIFAEGACVVAAHQFASAHGEAGFAGGEVQIAEMASMGKAIVARYRSKR